MIKSQKNEEFPALTIRKGWKYMRAAELKKHDLSLNNDELDEFKRNTLIPAFRMGYSLYKSSGGKVIDIGFVKEEPLRWRGILEALASDDKKAFDNCFKLHPERYE